LVGAAESVLAEETGLIRPVSQQVIEEAAGG